ncbi:hypothetical protein D9V75_00365 [Buchnera aphidicola (Muscaphis stroyani)]|uniref:Flagellar motor switch protein FliM n=1 Tax=Buchnera aphidicola (Muscaphis stroyani) TaxID=1241869 RepID=A0A4D6Y3K8_9GAMM|nr:FliM/FliN family flagellar motor switch protein [Buchnera aphidicola]QCI24186.1 hypothetical protein D9V75_00365 [Buchnera aphidicola (Muscaphis stroyani)]
MGKSNNFHNKLKKVYSREENLKNFITQEEINELEEINYNFIHEIIKNLSDFSKGFVKLTSYSINIESNFFIEKPQFKIYSNLIETFHFQKKSFIFLSSNFLPTLIDVLFGGNGCFQEDEKKTKITYTEYLINTKLIKIILESFTNACKKFFLIKMKFINTKILFHLKDFNHNSTKTIISRFNLYINNVKVYFIFLIPLSIVKKLKNSTFISSKKVLNLEGNDLKTISIDDLDDVKLEIIVKLNGISVSESQLSNLSVGNIFSIQNPNKIIALIEKKQILLGYYKSYNDKSAFLVKEFINDNLNSITTRNISMSNLKKNIAKKNFDNSKKLINSKKNINHESCYFNEASVSDHNIKNNTLYDSKKEISHKNIIENLPVNITVQLGKLKIKIKDFLNLSKDNVLILDKSIQEPLDVFMNDCLIASGEIVFLENKYGLRITEVKNNFKKKLV